MWLTYKISNLHKEESSYCNMFHLPCINQIHNIQTTNKIHFNMYDVFYSLNSHQHVSAAIAVIFRAIFYYKNTKLQMWLVVSPSEFLYIKHLWGHDWHTLQKLGLRRPSVFGRKILPRIYGRICERGHSGGRGTIWKQKSFTIKQILLT